MLICLDYYYYSSLSSNIASEAIKKTIKIIDPSDTKNADIGSLNIPRKNNTNPTPAITFNVPLRFIALVLLEKL